MALLKNPFQVEDHPWSRALRIQDAAILRILGRQYLDFEPGRNGGPEGAAAEFVVLRETVTADRHSLLVLVEAGDHWLCFCDRGSDGFEFQGGFVAFG